MYSAKNQPIATKISFVWGLLKPFLNNACSFYWCILQTICEILTITALNFEMGAALAHFMSHKINVQMYLKCSHKYSNKPSSHQH